MNNEQNENLDYYDYLKTQIFYNLLLCEHAIKEQYLKNNLNNIDKFIIAMGEYGFKKNFFQIQLVFTQGEENYLPNNGITIINK